MCRCFEAGRNLSLSFLESNPSTVAWYDHDVITVLSFVEDAVPYSSL